MNRGICHLLLFLGLFLNPCVSHAGSFYFEPGGGISQLLGGDPFFPGVTRKTDFGMNFTMALGANFSNGASAIEYHAGFMTRYSQSSDLSGSYTLITAYPFFRLQVTKLFLTLGLTPLIWKEFPTTLGNRINGVSGLAEMGLLWPLTPKFSLCLTGGMEFVSSGGNLSPRPAVAFIGAMRFYFGSPGGEMPSSNEFKGWRYPFGNELRN